MVKVIGLKPAICVGRANLAVLIADGPVVTDVAEREATAFRPGWNCDAVHSKR